MRTDKLAPCHAKSTPETDKHCTPKAFFKYLEKVFKVKFTIDVAASKKNRLCASYLDEKADAITKVWPGIAWCNPPYSKAGLFVAKAWDNSDQGFGTTFMLMASRTDTDWWTLTQHAYLIVYIKGRLKFAGSSAGAPFPSVVLIFKKNFKGQTKNIYLAPSPYERGFQRGKPE